MLVRVSTVNEAVMFDRLQAQVPAHGPWAGLGSKGPSAMGPFAPGPGPGPRAHLPWAHAHMAHGPHGSAWQQLSKCIYISLQSIVYEIYGLIIKIITTLAEKWWAVKQGAGSQVLIHYTEESREVLKEKEIGKQIRGGGELSAEDGKKMMIAGLESSWSEGMLGVEEESSDDEPASRHLGAAGSSGMGSDKRLKLEGGQASVVHPTQTAQPAKAAKPFTKKEKEALAKAEKGEAKKKSKEEKMMQLQLAKEQEAQEKEKAAAEIQAELRNINCLRRQGL